MAIKFDLRQFLARAKELKLRIENQRLRASFAVGGEVLRLSSFEVPHDQGLLQSSASVEPEEEGAIVGYNKVYAARLHEHPEYRFQKGRKGKFLEDPIKNNMKALGGVFTQNMKEAL